MNATMLAGRRTGALLLALACSAAVIASPARVSGQNALSAARPGTRLIDCAHDAVYKPTSFVLACGDGNASLVRLRWSTWSNSHATAAGVFSVNDCQPYCAAGHFHNYPANVQFDRPIRSSKGIAFDRVVLRFPRSAPPGRRTITQDHLVPTM